MKFKSLRDRLFIVLWIVIVLIVNLCFLFPLVFSPPLEQVVVIIVILLDLIITALLIWIVADISYSLKDQYLVVKAGMIKSRIQYKDITKITRYPNIWMGYRLLFAKEAIEVHYKTGMMGSVKISPRDKEIFIKELKKRNSEIVIEPAKSI
ncbi:MAG TPA: PH domain-containing protein [Candidatus Paenibacillus intestinavium]|nr:PH domain-containing protein [Candidatus Paenibacillus intestinavium]